MRTWPNPHPILPFWEKACGEVVHARRALAILRGCDRGSGWRALPQPGCTELALIPAGIASSPARVASASPDACLSEQNRQQARAQEHEAGCRQNKKSVGDNVVVAHDTPTTSDARPNLLKSSEFPDRNYRAVSLSKVSLPESPGGLPEPPAVQNSSSGTIAFKCMGKKNACAHQAHQCCNCLDHRTNPLRPCHPQNDCNVAQSKRFTGWNRRSVVSDDLVQQIV